MDGMHHRQPEDIPTRAEAERDRYYDQYDQRQPLDEDVWFAAQELVKPITERTPA